MAIIRYRIEPNKEKHNDWPNKTIASHCIAGAIKIYLKELNYKAEKYTYIDVDSEVDLIVTKVNTYLKTAGRGYKIENLQKIEIKTEN